MNNSISTSALRAVLTDRGAQKTAVRLEQEEKLSLTMKNGSLCSAETCVNTKVLIKVESDGLFAEKEYTVGSGADLGRVAEDIMQSLSERESVFISTPEEKCCELIDRYDEPDGEGMAERLRKLFEQAESAGYEVPKAILEHRRIRCTYENELGMLLSSAQSGYRLSCGASIEKNGKSITPIRIYKTFAALDEMPAFPSQEPLAQNAQLLLEPQRIPGFTGTLIIAPGTLYYMLLDFLFGRLFEEAIASHASEWADSMGEKVLSERFSASMDPFHTYAVFGERIRSDGTLSKPYAIIENGVVRSFIVTPQSAAQLSLPACGNDSDDLVIPAGEVPVADMIAQTEKGILIFGFSGGEGDDGFAGNAPLALYIENGRVVCAADNPVIAGSWHDILSGADFDFSKERSSDGEYLLPYIRIKNFEFR